MDLPSLDGASPPDALVAVLEIDPLHRLAVGAGPAVAVAAGRRLVDEAVDRLAVDPAIVELSTTRVAVMTASAGQHTVTALVDMFDGGAIRVEFDGEPCFVDIRVGIATRATLSGAPNWADLIRYAHYGLTRTVVSSRRVFAVDDGIVAGLEAERVRMGLLARAVPADFRLHYQPIVSLTDHRVVGYEALMRWYNDGRPLYGPSMFFPRLEETELLRPVTHACVQTAVTDLVGRLGTPATTFVAINLSERQLLDGGCVATLIETAGAVELDLDRIWIELREDAVIRRPSRVGRTIERLGDAGCTICIDDLGAGYSALSYIKDLPIGVVKLDIELTGKLLTDPMAVTITRAICDLAQATGLKTVAEGVEVPELLPTLRDLRFDYAQGFLFGRPEPVELLGR